MGHNCCSVALHASAHTHADPLHKTFADAAATTLGSVCMEHAGSLLPSIILAVTHTQLPRQSQQGLSHPERKEQVKTVQLYVLHCSSTCAR